MNILGQRIAQRRKELKMSQEDLALLLKTHQRQISRYETGQNDPTVSVLVAIASVLETTPAWLLGFEDDTRDDLSVDERELIDLYRRKDKAGRIKLLEIAEIL